MRNGILAILLLAALGAADAHARAPCEVIERYARGMRLALPLQVTPHIAATDAGANCPHHTLIVRFTVNVSDDPAWEGKLGSVLARLKTQYCGAGKTGNVRAGGWSYHYSFYDFNDQPLGAWGYDPQDCSA